MIILSFFSFIADGILSLLFEKNSLFLSLFSLMSLVIIYPYVKNKKNIIYIGSIIGLLYDIVYTQTLFLNTLVFTLLAFFLVVFYKYVPYHILNSVLISVVLVVLFRCITYFAFIFFNDYEINFKLLFKSISSSLILNILYVFIMHYFLKYISIKNTKKGTRSTFVRKNY